MNILQGTWFQEKEKNNLPFEVLSQTDSNHRYPLSSGTTSSSVMFFISFLRSLFATSTPTALNRDVFLLVCFFLFWLPRPYFLYIFITQLGTFFFFFAIFERLITHPHYRCFICSGPHAIAVSPYISRVCGHARCSGEQQSAQAHLIFFWWNCIFSG